MPQEIHKTVFISYRRKAASFHARAIFENLKSHGYDVFMDVESIDAGDFKRIIENQIKARAHFLVVLTAGTVGKFDNPTDMMRYEIEYAMEHQRNIVPLLINDFKFNKTTLKSLTGKLAELPKRNGAPIRHELFDGSMSNLRERFLSKPVDVLVSETPASDEAAVEKTLAEVAAEPVPTQEELSAEAYFAMGFEKQVAGDFEGATADFTEAIRLNPKYAHAYNNRGNTRATNNDFVGAIADYNEAIYINPQFTEAYYNRGITYADNGDLNNAINNYAEAIRLNPYFAEAYYNRANAYALINKFNRAITDYTEAIRLNPKYVIAYINRGNARAVINELDSAIADYTEAIRLNPEISEVHNNRGNARAANHDLVGAIADCTEAIRLNPQEVNAYINRGESYFALVKFEEALADFKHANAMRPNEPIIVAGLAITQFMLENYGEAKRIWRGLVEQDARYMDADWVGKEFNWRPELVEAARKLIATL